MPVGCWVAWHCYRAWESRGHGCWGVVRFSAKGMKQPGCLNLVERLVPLLKVQLVITGLFLTGIRRTSKPCILCTQLCSSRLSWYSSSLWSGRKEVLLAAHLHAHTAGEQWGLLRGAQAEPSLPGLSWSLSPFSISSHFWAQKYSQTRNTSLGTHRACSSVLLLFSPVK